MSRSFDLNLLPVLVAIYESGSVTSAAQHLGMSQSAVSTALARLRAKYGDPLFHRVGHGMRATARMRALIRPLRQALSEVDRTLASESVFTPATTQRTFTFGMSDLGEMVFMPKILKVIRQLAPRATVRSVASSAAQVERGLESGEIDLAVGYFPDLRDKSFLEKHLFYHHFVCLLRADHPITASTLTMSQFLALEHAVVYGAGRTYESFERLLRAKKIHRRVVLETPHFLSIPSIIARSDLVCTVPHAVGVFVRDVHMNIRMAQPPMRTPKIDLKLHWHRNFQRDPKNRWLREVVAALFTDDSDEWQE
ncbi:MAG TPA: LysR family transcriptional regulator [Steroidobacteraceae bacterium]|jgi:DNA-binding transcriptional LysR family regulator|nr:LysR family transcriptional regulator [Steroidobacteraceae bacterium]